MIKLQTKPELAKIKMSEAMQLEKEVKEGSEIIVAQVMVIMSESDNNRLEPIEVQPILRQYQDVFSEPKTLPPNWQFDHKIILYPQSKLVNLRPYQHSHYHKLELEKIIDELLKNSVIQHSTSPYASPTVLVKNKDGTWQLC